MTCYSKHVVHVNIDGLFEEYTYVFIQIMLFTLPSYSGFNLLKLYEICLLSCDSLDNR